MRNTTRISTFILFICVFFFVFANRVFAENDLKFNHLTVNDGLLHNSATCLAQDSLGYIWIGTQRGLNRFDGYKLDVYLNESDPFSSVYSNRIRKVLVYQNYLWIASYKGLECFDLRKKKYISFVEKGHNNFKSKQIIHNLKMDSKNRIWVSISGKLEGAFVQKEAGGFELKSLLINSKPFLELENLYTPEVVELKNGTILLLASGKVIELRPSTKNPLHFTTIAIKSEWLNPVKIAADGNDLWLIFSNKVIGVRYKNGAFVPFDTFSFTECLIQSVQFNSSQIWLSSNQGLIQVDKTPHKSRLKYHYHSPLDPNSISSNHQSALLIDKQNNLWVSTWSAGLSYTNIGKQKFELVKYVPFDTKKSLPSEFVYSIHVDKKNDVYVGTKFGGISRFDFTTKTFNYTINIKEKLGLNAVIPCIDSDDDWLYAGVTSQGSAIYRINKLTQQLELLKSYYPNTIFSFGFDAHNQLWVGVLKVGLACLTIENGKIVSEKLFSNKAVNNLKLSSNAVNYVFNDLAKNEVLISTDNGLNRLMLDGNGNVTSIAYYLASDKKLKSLSSNYVWPIDKENDSVYWVGTLGSGLNRIVIGKRVAGIADYKAEHFGKNDGAPSNDIESVEVDKYGDVWCGGRYLSRFNYKTRRFKTYYEEDGLQSYHFGTGTSFKSDSGMLFFGGLKGFNYFMPDSTREEIQYKVDFSRILVDNKVVNVGDTLNGQLILEADLQYIKSIDLPYPCNSLRIEFSSLAFTKNKSVNFRYKLEGFDAEWVYTDGMNAYAIYPKLPYKTYKFRVQVGADNLWSTYEKSILIDILPPWWLSPLALFLYFLVFVVILLLSAKYSLNWVALKRRISVQEEREKQKEELMELKMNFFTNISHEFKTPLTLINAAVDEVEVQNELLFGNKYFQVIKRNNLKLLHLISELMDYQRSNSELMGLKLTKVDVRLFVANIVEEFRPLSQRLGIELEVELPSNQVFAWVDEECLLKVISNIISNSLHYTDRGGSVYLQLSTGFLQTLKPKFESSITFVDDMQPGEQLIISVLDTGVGISTESLPSVFDRFHTIISKTSKHIGSGIGLALVKSLVKLHKGGVTISSERLKGTEFVVALPLDLEHVTDGEKQTDATFNSQLYLDNQKIKFIKEDHPICDTTTDDSKQTLLIVDDNQEIIMMLWEHLKADFNILTAYDGEHALGICNEKNPDLIISDVMMPRMNGLELCNCIKSQLKTCIIPVILLTARGTTEQQIEGLNEGADAYISKPFNLSLLRSTITNLLNKVKLSNELQKSNLSNFEDVKTTRISVLDKEKQQFIEKITILILSKIDNPNYTVDNLCVEIGVSRTRLYAQIKEIRNQTLGDFIREIRFQKAAELLRTTSLTIGEVAYQVGIESSSFFTRSFKEQFGMPPSEYLKKMKAQNKK